MKVLTIFGTRPEAIKMCPVIMELDKHNTIECKTCLTGQHKEMLSQVMDLFQVQADYNLEIMKQNQSLSMILRDVLIGLDRVIDIEKPDLILVHGDTSSSFAAALSAFYHQIPVAHVEAGLRTYNMHSPYPEEFNRQAVDLITDLYFAPTELAKRQLLMEGKDESKIYVTGNTVIDALKTTVKKDFQHEILDWSAGNRMILMTAHRRENIGDSMRHMFRAIVRIVEENTDVRIVYPVHKNPKVREMAKQILGNYDQIRLIEPLNVYEFHNLINCSYFIVTDSGGIQEEAPSLGKPVLVMRDVTERQEGIEAGTLKLVGTDENQIYQAMNRLLSDKDEYKRMSHATNPYGDGNASKRIVQIIQEFLGEKDEASNINCATNI